MKKIFAILLSVLIVIGITYCSSSSPSNDLIIEEYEIVKTNVKTILGTDFKAENFEIIKEGFTDGIENQYIIFFTFDLNKKYLLFEGKKISAQLIFEKSEEGEWKCRYNSVKVGGVLNLLK
ncbi:MAG: hypothetical protein V1773_02510 [bacterium]